MLHEHLLRKVPIFDGCHDEFVRALARQLRAEVLIAGDYAFKMNEMGKSMYFLQTGFMQARTHVCSPWPQLAFGRRRSMQPWPMLASAIASFPIS